MFKKFQKVAVRKGKKSGIEQCSVSPSFILSIECNMTDSQLVF